MEVMLDPLLEHWLTCRSKTKRFPRNKNRPWQKPANGCKHNPGIPFEQVVAKLGFTTEEATNYQDLT